MHYLCISTDCSMKSSTYSKINSLRLTTECSDETKINLGLPKL
ncbi:hypothetical protein [Methanosphaera sp.]